MIDGYKVGPGKLATKLSLACQKCSKLLAVEGMEVWRISAYFNGVESYQLVFCSVDCLNRWLNTHDVVDYFDAWASVHFMLDKNVILGTSNWVRETSFTHLKFSL